MREETEGAGGGKGRGSLSSALPFLSRWNTQMSLSSRPAPPPSTTTQWGGGPREPGPLAPSATTAVDRRLRKGERMDVVLRDMVPVDTERGQEEEQSWRSKGNKVQLGWHTQESPGRSWGRGQADGALPQGALPQGAAVPSQALFCAPFHRPSQQTQLSRAARRIGGSSLTCQAGSYPPHRQW